MVATYTAKFVGKWAGDFDLAVFGRVNRQGIVYRLDNVDIGDSVLPIMTLFRSQLFVVNGCQSKLVNDVSGVPQGSVLGQLFFLLCI